MGKLYPQSHKTQLIGEIQQNLFLKSINRLNTAKPIPSGSDSHLLRPLNHYTNDAVSFEQTSYASPLQAMALSKDQQDWSACLHK